MEWQKIIHKNKKILLYGVFILIVASVIILVLRNRRPMTMGVVADIHAGHAKHRNMGNGNDLTPKDYCKNLKKVFSQAKADFYIALGDNTLDGGNVEADMVIDCVKKNKKDFIWVRGNHDNDRAWKEFRLPNYYYKDKGNWRIIVLYDSVYDARLQGGIDIKQLNWLKDKLNTNKKVIIAQHHPLWGTKDNPDTTNPSTGKNFKQEAEILAQHKNVKYVFSGHTHLDNFCVKKDSYTYCRVYALSLVGHEGSYMKFDLK